MTTTRGPLNDQECHHPFMASKRGAVIYCANCGKTQVEKLKSQLSAMTAAAETPESAIRKAYLALYPIKHTPLSNGPIKKT